MKLYIADLHFGHQSVINFDSRPFADVNEMDRFLIDSWNRRVTKNDQVYIVGDFAYRNEKPFSWYLKRLAGEKHLIVGNHDKKLLKDEQAMGYFASAEYQLEITDNQKHIVLSHFPLAEWSGFFGDVYQIYGHIHNRTDGAFSYMKNLDRALNAGACINNYTPVSFPELVTNNRTFRENRESAR